MLKSYQYKGGGDARFEAIWTDRIVIDKQGAMIMKKTKRRIILERMVGKPVE